MKAEAGPTGRGEDVINFRGSLQWSPADHVMLASPRAAVGTRGRLILQDLCHPALPLNKSRLHRVSHGAFHGLFLAHDTSSLGSSTTSGVACTSSDVLRSLSLACLQPAQPSASPGSYSALKLDSLRKFPLHLPKSSQPGLHAACALL
ncbi:unnamed protein product [Rangifer tarandus platyrhynchus]|uniref:Uncharacterized protein n=1 Tax=Rangifer tarandus platyrhynchus TaxID=3082113 RepID=A0AC59ZR15_RANTA